MAGVLLKCAAVCLIGTAVGSYGGCATERAGVRSDTTIQNAHDDFGALRERMVEQHLRGRDIADKRVLDAMLKIPRHEFVPPELRESSYEDGPLPVGLGQTISQPYIVAFMTQALQLRGTERVLEIGTGSGYQAAVLAEVAAQVYTIEILPELTQRARTILEAQGYRNIFFRTGDGYQGWPEEAPFDAIIVTAAPDHVPEPLVDQLKPGGRMILPVGRFEQELVIIEKTASGLRRRSSIPVRFVPMTGRALQGTPR
jgi:protein-L-isoaspartate(D-aspartate) O-methyltransferase